MQVREAHSLGQIRGDDGRVCVWEAWVGVGVGVLRRGSRPNPCDSNVEYNAPDRGEKLQTHRNYSRRSRFYGGSGFSNTKNPDIVD